MRSLCCGALLVLASIQAIAQQNFINVPSAELTPKHKLFFQQQLNFNELLQSNTTLDFGLGKGFEAGINVLGLNYSRAQFFIKNDTNDRDPYNPLLAANVLKQFRLSDRLAVACGMQLGANFRNGRETAMATLLYANLRLNDWPLKGSCLVAGGYYNSRHYGGMGNRVGGWFGAEVEALKKLHLLAESVVGENALCFTSVGLVYYPVEHIPLTLALQIPNTRRNAYSLVFELTIIPRRRA